MDMCVYVSVIVSLIWNSEAILYKIVSNVILLGYKDNDPIKLTANVSYKDSYFLYCKCRFFLYIF